MNVEELKERVHQFLNGYRSIDRLIKVEYDFSKPFVYLRVVDENDNHKLIKDDFYPFVWTTRENANSLFNGDRDKIFSAMDKYGIGVKHLKVRRDEDTPLHDRLEMGYRLLFFAKKPMSMMDFQKFFKKGGSPLYGNRDNAPTEKPYITLGGEEMYLIQSGNRVFKGYNDLDELKRLVFDIETEGLDPNIHKIRQIGIRTNRGFEKIIEIISDEPEEEINAIREFFKIVKEEKPSVVSGYNSENFDFWFFDQRLQKHGVKMSDLTSDLFPKGVYKSTKDRVLKLGGEVEFYKPTFISCYNVTDGLFAVRRAQAIDSNMESASLKYVTKYSRLNSKNRVYVEGGKINTIWEDLSLTYMLNVDNGEWSKISEEEIENEFTITDKTIEDSDGNTYQGYLHRDGQLFYLVNGRYIVYRYLQDDLQETLLVEYRYNLPNFLVAKMIPVSYDKMCTMGTAVIWKLIMLAWSYENDLAIPSLIETRKFTGGLSRLFEVGFVDKVAKLDYNSLYPSIIITMGINSSIDVSNAMSLFLEYFLTKREEYKELKGVHGKKANEYAKLVEEGVDVEKNSQLMSLEKKESAHYDKLQLPIKIMANGFFGSYGSGLPFPHSDIYCAEETTCTGRMMFRLLLSWFNNRGYKPIVGDSFSSDTPLFVKSKLDGKIDIVEIRDLFNVNYSTIDDLGREYDTSYKPYYVLCNSGWKDVTYIYRHKTDKEMYRVSEGNMSIDITEDHSLFDNDMNKISPNDISNDTKLKYYSEINSIRSVEESIEERTLRNIVANYNATGYVDKAILNADIDSIRKFLSEIQDIDLDKVNKTNKAKLLFLKNLCQM